MINNLSRLFVSLFGARLWLQSLEFARKRDYQLALSKLIRMETMGVAPYTEYCLLRGFIEYMLSNNDSSVYYLDLAIEKIASSNKFKKMEKDYLKLYAKGFCHHTVSVISKVPTLFISANNGGSLNCAPSWLPE